jgi:hypothetical protein
MSFVEETEELDHPLAEAETRIPASLQTRPCYQPKYEAPCCEDLNAEEVQELALAAADESGRSRVDSTLLLVFNDRCMHCSDYMFLPWKEVARVVREHGFRVCQFNYRAAKDSLPSSKLKDLERALSVKCYPTLIALGARTSQITDTLVIHRTLDNVVYDRENCDDVIDFLDNSTRVLCL